MLIRLEAARLGFERCRAVTGPINLEVRPASTGGHALLGENGSGKTLIAQALLRRGGPLLRAGRVLCRDGWSARSVGHVSFTAHQQLLASAHDSVYRSLGHLTPASRYLVVRFGLHPLLYRPVGSISTGEIRKVLLVRALASRPHLILLDNAFDGLDAPSRQNLANLVSQTLRGFGEVLVQGVEASATAHSQVLMLTHRAEEIVDEIDTVSTISLEGDLTSTQRSGRDGAALLSDALGDGSGARMPAAGELAALWGSPISPPHLHADCPLVEARGLCLSRGETALLQGTPP